jgi:hypothetical protein
VILATLVVAGTTAESARRIQSTSGPAWSQVVDGDSRNLVAGLLPISLSLLRRELQDVH